MSHFSGQVSHQVDGKNRIRIPARYRQELGDELDFILWPGQSNCVYLFPKQVLDERIEALGKIALSDKPRMDALRIISSSRETVKEDDQGRAVFPETMRRAIGVTDSNRELVTVGMVDHLEIWLKTRYDEYTSQMTLEEAFALVGF